MHDEGVFVGCRWYEREVQPFYNFGLLSHTTYEYSYLKLEKEHP
jgi:hypothetical protein